MGGAIQVPGRASQVTPPPTYMYPTLLAGIRRAWWKKVRNWPGETCQRCGRMYGADRCLNMHTIWRATDEAWATIIGYRLGGLYCPSCFIRGCAVTGHVAYMTIDLDTFPERETP